MTSLDCRSYKTCNAVLCPVDKDSWKPVRIWYPDEPICQDRKFQTLAWVKKQKQIAKKHGSIERFFNIKMLDAIKQVHKGIEGANPDLPLTEKADDKWIKQLQESRSQKKGDELAITR